MIIELIRHGETAYNRDARYQGKADIPLSDAGREKLHPAGFAAGLVYTSPLSRARETAAILFPNSKLVPVAGLEEMDFGAFEGKNYKEMERDPAYRAWVESGCESQCPGGESKAVFCRRVCAAFAGLTEESLRAGAPRLTVVAHGGTLMAVMERYAQPPKSYFEWNVPPGCGFLLDAARWQEGILQYMGQSDYRKEVTP